MKFGPFDRFKAAWKGFTFSASGGSGYGNGFGWLANLLPGAQYDYRREAGDLWKSGIILPCLKWKERNLPEPVPVVQKRDAKGKWQNVDGHKLLDLLNRPNAFFDWAQLVNAISLSLDLDGNAYLIKVRSGAGKSVELWWVPHWQMEPAWNENGSDFISYYLYHVNGKDIAVKIEDVIHFRDGTDPANPRKGLSPLSAQLREVCTDNEGATFSAAVCRNMGVPGVIISPDGSGSGQNDIELDTANAYKRQWIESYTGDRRGEPLVFLTPTKVEKPGFSPEELVLDKIRRIPEERISAALGIPAVVIGLGAGLERATFANYKEAREAAYESGIIPTLKRIAATITRQLLGEFGDEDRERLWFDTADVRALQEDQTALHTRLDNSYKAGWLKRGEARLRAGYEATPDDEVYITDVSQANALETLAATPDPVLPGDNGDANNKPPPKKPNDKKAADPLTWAERLNSELRALEGQE